MRPCSRRSGKQVLEGRPGADQPPMAGQVLRMNGNGRLTAPPEFKVVLVTNSVDGMMSQGTRNRPRTGSTRLASFSPSTRTSQVRHASCPGGPGASRTKGPENFNPVCAPDAFTTHASATRISVLHDLSESKDVAASILTQCVRIIDQALTQAVRTLDWALTQHVSASAA